MPFKHAYLLLLTAAILSVAHAEPLGTPLTQADLDPAAFVQWVGGQVTTTGLPPRGPNFLVWTRDSRPEWSGSSFGASPAPGIRHLRIGFTKPQAIGTVLVRGGGVMSVLRPTAPYPGDPSNDALWLPAQRLAGDRVTHDEVDRETYALWTPPPGTTTRALRFTHTAAVTDNDYAGWLGGVAILPQRLANVALQATAVASANGHKAQQIVNGGNDGTWGAWDNGAEGRAKPISAEDPEWVELIWPAPVTVRGLDALWAGFGSCEVQAFTGPATQHPREAAETDWKLIGHFDKLENGYPLQLWPNWLTFDETVTTRALRVRLTSVTKEGHPHLNNNTRGGKRVWLGELQVLTDLGVAELKSAILPKAAGAAHPPIPIRFHLPEAGLVTLVIGRADGVRVRNLVSETPFPAGDNTAWWDGTDDLGRDPQAAAHGLYFIPRQLVEPGRYFVRGMWRKPLELHYEFSIYNGGNPPWETADKSGGWLTNHTPPSSVAFVPDVGNGKPAVLIGSYVAEGGAGLAWVDLEGRKTYGQGWVGGNWTGAPYLCPAGRGAPAGVYAYVGAAWEGQLRLTAIAPNAQKAVLAEPYKFPAAPETKGDKPMDYDLAGIAADGGRLVCSLPRLGKLLLIDLASGKPAGEITVEQPKGLAFDPTGRLLVLSGTRLLRFDKVEAGATPTPLVAAGLEAPTAVASGGGRIYVSDRGASHQVKVFDADGKPLAPIGKPGAPAVGPYDPNHLNNPRGLAVDANGRLWVAEEDYQPKRVSLWNADGTLYKAFYGPAQYGGGGKLDPKDPNRFYYDGMEFALDWKAGKDKLSRIYWRRGLDPSPDGGYAEAPPECPHYVGGRQYMTNAYNTNPTNGANTVGLWLMRDGLAQPVAVMGRARDWSALDSLLPNPLPDGAKREQIMFCWSDLNGDRKLSADELQWRKADSGGITIGDDLSFKVARVDGKAQRFRPKAVSAAGVPSYDLAKGEVLAENAQWPTTSGGDQILVSDNGWTVSTVSPKPFAPQGFGGTKDGKTVWSYPSLWPGLHASHEAPVPDRLGEVIGSTRLLGPLVTPRGGEAGPLWFVNGNHGNVYVLTADGLFVAQLFQDMRVGQTWSMPRAERNMRLDEQTLHDENFWPTVTQTADGRVFLCDGQRTSLVRVDGLDTVHRLPAQPLDITKADLERSAQWYTEAEAARQGSEGHGTLLVAMPAAAPKVDGKLDDWVDAAWVDVDKRGTAAYFNSNSKPYDVRAAMAVSGDKLYAAWRTGDANLLRNSGEVANALFKTGGALDLMLGTDPAANDKRDKPVPGDLRLLITRVGKDTKATLYRAVVPGTKEPVPFSSPWRTITFDQVQDVSAQVELAGADGDFEIAVPLAILGLQPKPGLSLRGDIGILRGDGSHTQQRVYWSNKATAIVADVPSEAMLAPNLWGTLHFAP